MDNEFKAGDVVLLKSGGPKMTIKGIGQIRTGRFRRQCAVRLVREDETDGSGFRASHAH